jgi:H+/Cl- antiporter ClcA
MLCGLMVGVCGLLSGDSIYGTGYREVSAALNGTQSLSQGFGALKFIATALTAVSTLPGGIFSPSLAIGAGLGANVAAAFADIDASAVMLLGMVAYLAGVVQAPITAFVIVMEMTDNHAMLIPLMAAALIAHATSRLVCREGIYHALANRLLESVKRPPSFSRSPS